MLVIAIVLAITLLKLGYYGVLALWVGLEVATYILYTMLSD